MAKGAHGQLSLDDARVNQGARATSRLDKIDRQIDWARIEAVLRPMMGTPAGQEGYPVLTLFKAQLLGHWYSLSDPELEEALGDRLSFRRFAGLGLDAPVPDHSTLWRFRDQLAQRGLAEAAFEEIGRQLEAQGLMVKQGTLLDATLVQAQARPPRGVPGGRSDRDPDADWHGRYPNGTYGYKMHTGVDQGTQLIRTVEFTPASWNESVVADRLICGDERAVFGDKAYESKTRRQRLRDAGILDAIMHRSHKNQAALPAWQQERNAWIGPIRQRIEKVFGTLKRHYGWHRARAYTLARNRADALLTAIAYNLRRAQRLRSAA